MQPMMQPQLKSERWAVIMAVAEPMAEPVARLVLVRLSTPTDSLLPCRRTRGRQPAHRAQECYPWMSKADPLRPS